ncbi:hypothetical protein [Shewanella sp. MEBiC00475]|uniref:hypothetical protein n=1 Tax=Shewanella sp. MEBiC00475 TaxID=2575361 RepID=UPI0010BFF7EA|nr:hypothetical protein [Shewanella sp. MEBiC00475]
MGRRAKYAAKNSINFRRNFYAAVVWLKSENVAGTAGVIQEGIAVDPLLVRAGWNLAILIQTQFDKSGVGEAPRR